MLDFSGVPLGCNKVDDCRLYLLQRAAGFPQECAAGLAELAGALIKRQVVSAVFGTFWWPITVQTSKGSFHIKQSPSDVHQGAVVDQLALCTELFDQFNVFCNDFSWNSQTQYGKRVAHLHHAGEKVLKLAVLAQF